MELYYMWVVVVFAFVTNVRKFSTSFYFCGEERFFHVINIPIIVIKPKTSFEWNFVTEVFLVTEFSMYGVGAYL